MSIERTPLEHGNRELRYDFLRGMALLVVLVDHIEDQSFLKAIRPWMPVSTCYFDGAEAFVFLSGLVFGRAFQRHLQQRGLLACQQKAVRRAISIYLTYLVMALIVIGMGVCFRNYSSRLVERLSLTEGAVQCVRWTLPMCYQPWGFPILAVYAVILPFMPLLLCWRLRSAKTAWIIPLGLYVATQMIPNLQLPRFPWGREWIFNPFAWQFLFFIGMSVGTTRIFGKIKEMPDQTDADRGAAFWTSQVPNQLIPRDRDLAKTWQSGETAREPDCRRSPSLTRAFFWGSLAILVAGLLIRNNLIGAIPGAADFQKTLVHFSNEWSHKTRIQPIRIIHFMSLVIVLSAVLPAASAKIWHSRLLAPVIKCGQNSLAVYSFGLFLTFLSIVVFRLIGESLSTILMIEFDCCVLSVGLAYLLDWYRRTRQNLTEKSTQKFQSMVSQYQ
ncbi:OpgC domain-containing protein [Schlesneria paludicola]|uniref:OpgC domain-containing protein n=1 Tax=Schlesneria paludicola TaxID=360056 RepID=UPI00029A1F77|nr:OpgC domain-containing protein [Schlesneria paludicola]